MKRQILLIALFSMCVVVNAQYPRASLWTADMSGFAAQDANGVKKDVVLFAGSSTFTMWSSLKTDFPNSKVLNRAFGGSMMTDLLYFFNQVVAPYSPRQVVLYEGDNDLYGTTKTPEQFMDDVIAMIRLINIYYPNAKILLVSIKPSPSRASAFAKYQAANLLMKNYADKFDYIDYVDTWSPMLKQDGTPNETLFGSDMLHMNASGYALWKSILEPLLLTALPETEAKDIILFDESSNATYHEPSWVNATAPSTFTTAKDEKISCDSAHHHAGATSLKLAYQGIGVGNWKACVAAKDWAAFDVSGLKELEMYVYSDNKVDSINLPYVYLESYSSTTTAKLRLSNYINGISAATWTKVVIPIQDWKAKSPSFAYNNVKAVFFSQMNLNTAPIVIYVDDIIFRLQSGGSNPGTGNSGNIFVDFGSPSNSTTGNWNNITDHQGANVELIDDQGAKTGITLTITDPFYNGYNTSGTTAPTGDAAAIFPSTATSDNFFGHGNAWSTTAANPEGIFTLSGLDKTKYYSFKIFGSRPSASDDRETLYTATGAGTKTATLNASTNVSSFAKIDSLLPDNSGVINIKCSAGVNNTTAEKFYYIGAMKITVVGNQTGINLPKTAAFSAYYSNGVIKVPEYTGKLTIYNLGGTIVAQGHALYGQCQLNLPKGTYIIKSTIGNTSLLVY